MSLRDIAHLLVKIAGLVIIVLAISNLVGVLAYILSSAPGMMRDGSGREYLREALLAAAIPPAVFFAAGLTLFWGAGTIADRILVRPVGPITDKPISLHGIEEIVLVVLGLYVFATGLADMAGALARFDWSSEKMYLARFVEIGPAGARMAFGAVLVLFSRGFVVVRRRVLSLRPMAAERD